MPPMGNTFNDADDGCGIAHYPSGKVAALVTKVSGFKYFAFFDSNTEGKLIAAASLGRLRLATLGHCRSSSAVDCKE